MGGAAFTHSCIYTLGSLAILQLCDIKQSKTHRSSFYSLYIYFYGPHLVVVRPWWYGELHDRHERRQLQPSDVQLSVGKTLDRI